MLRKCWQLAADSNGESILTFGSIIEFEKMLADIDRKTPLYIDSDLGSGIKGEECAKQLFEQGFHEIYLATATLRSILRPWVSRSAKLPRPTPA